MSVSRLSEIEFRIERTVFTLSLLYQARERLRYVRLKGGEGVASVESVPEGKGG